MNRCLIILLCLCFTSHVWCAEPAVTAKDSSSEWKLVWNDEFEYEGLPAQDKWGYEVGRIRNREAQYYAEARLKNTRVVDGHLIIEAHQENFQGAQYTAGSLISAADWKYGRVEVRAKLPTGRGMWPAIWMMPRQRSGGWPACGEIDIMENVGFAPDVIHGTVHTKRYNHTIGTQKGGTITAEKPYDKFCIYAIEWDEDKIDFFLDGQKYFTFQNEGTGDETWPFDKPFHLKLNIAVGGSWGGQKGIDDSIFPQQFLIDYVRVYQ